MKRFLSYCLGTVGVGFFAVLPIWLACLVVGKVVGMLATMIKPLLRFAPGILFDNPLYQQGVTIVVLLVVLFLIEASKVTILNVPAIRVARCITHWGEGSAAVLQSLETRAPTTPIGIP